MFPNEKDEKDEEKRYECEKRKEEKRSGKESSKVEMGTMAMMRARRRKKGEEKVRSRGGWKRTREREERRREKKRLSKGKMEDILSTSAVNSTSYLHLFIRHIFITIIIIASIDSQVFIISGNLSLLISNKALAT